MRLAARAFVGYTVDNGMFRSSSTPAIVLHKARVGEIHKALTLLTPARGLLYALAYGACKLKSRFRTASEPFNLVTVYLYHDPVKNQYKITDLEAQELFPGIRKSLETYYTASLWAEVLLRSYGGGAGPESRELFQLVLEAFRSLDRAEPGRVLFINLQFLFRYLSLCGFFPELDSCGLCDTPVGRDETLRYSPAQNLFLCPSCSEAQGIQITAGARQYLRKTLALPFGQAVRIALEGGSLSALKEIAYKLVQAALETRLNSLQCASGYL